MTKQLIASIAAGGTLSAPVMVANLQVLSLLVPTGWTPANLTFQTSVDGGATWLDAYDDAGTELTVIASALRHIPVSLTGLAGIQWLRLRSGPGSSAIAQVAARAVGVIVQEVG